MLEAWSLMAMLGDSKEALGSEPSGKSMYLVTGSCPRRNQCSSHGALVSSTVSYNTVRLTSLLSSFLFGLVVSPSCTHAHHDAICC
jgi:hypothetical protein